MRKLLPFALPLLSAASALASGLSKPVLIGPKAVGMGGAFVSIADDPTAIFHNPAGMTRLAGHHLQAGMDSLVTSLDYTCDSTFPYCPGATRESAEKELLPVPNVFYTRDVSRRVALGLGVYFPHGNGARFSAPSADPLNPLEGRIYSMEIAPAAAFQIIPELSVGISVRAIRVSSSLKGQLIPGTPLGNVTLEDLSVSGWGAGASAGVLYEPNEHFATGLNYRSKASVSVSGDAAFAGVPADTASYDQVLPTLLTYGFSVAPLDHLTASFALGWERNSEIEPYTVTLATLYPAGFDIGKTWSDSYTIHLGLEYRPSPALALRAGYAKDLNDSIPDEQLNRILGDVAAHEVSIGAGYRWGRYDLGLTWNARFGTRDVPVTATNPAPGHYDGFVQSINLGISINLGATGQQAPSP